MLALQADLAEEKEAVEQLRGEVEQHLADAASVQGRVSDMRMQLAMKSNAHEATAAEVQQLKASLQDTEGALGEARVGLAEAG